MSPPVGGTIANAGGAPGASGGDGGSGGSGGSMTMTAGAGASGGAGTMGAGASGSAGAGGVGMMGGAGGMGGTTMAGMGGGSGSSGSGGGSGVGGSSGTGGSGGSGGTGGSSGAGGSGGTAGSAGSAGSAAPGETGKMIGMTAAHNAVRAMVATTPALEPMTWSTTLADYAQEWADSLAANNCAFMHRSNPPYGENIASFGAMPVQPNSSAQDAVDGWAAEVDCWTYGTFDVGDQCDTSCYMQLSSDGCGHYTQIVWRSSTKVGCGYANCTRGGINWDLWVCNYDAPGNFVGMTPY